MMPSLFLAHGSPMLSIEENSYTQALESLPDLLPGRPRAIVIFSAHYETPVQEVGVMDIFPTIHDFGGFPRVLYEIEYPARGDRDIAAEAAELLRQAGIPVRLNETRGLDHGHWVVLRKLYPQADIPVIPMSVNSHLTVAQQYAIGQALHSLRAKDVLVIGSGSTIHNFSYIDMRDDSGHAFEWSVQFEDWLEETLTKWNLADLANYRTAAPHADKAVPLYGSEHFVPLIYAMGAADDVRTARRLHLSFRYKSLSHTIWEFGRTDL